MARRKVQKNTKVAGKMYCWFCGAEMIWGCDFSYDDYGREGEGIVATFSCSKCKATAEVYSEG